MIIEENPIEKQAMKAFHTGRREEGLKIQEEFASRFRLEYAEKDHCPCKKACRYHGNCKECVAIHRAMVNMCRTVCALSSITNSKFCRN